MLTFTQNGGKILSGGYLINSKLLNEKMTEKMGVPAGLQVGGNEQNIETLTGNTANRGVLNDSIFNRFIELAGGRKKNNKKKTERFKKAKKKNKTSKNRNKKKKIECLKLKL